MDIYEYLRNNRGIEFTQQQQMVINHKDKPALILAVPGSGKSTSLLTRTANLVLNHNVDPMRILTMTFSKESTKDLMDRFKFLFNEINSISLNKVEFSTIHSFAFSVVRKHYKNDKLIKGFDVENAISKIYKEYIKKDIDSNKIGDIVSAISYVKNKMINMHNVDNATLERISPIKVSEFRKVYLEYYNYKKNNGLIDFDDMLTICHEILKVEKIGNQYINQYDYIQLDEVQDTSVLQFAIVEQMINSRGNIFYIGDLDQNIMGFTGTDSRQLLTFKNRFPDGQIYKLEQNFRSTQDIVEVADEFIKGNKSRYNVNMITERGIFRPIEILMVDNEVEEAKYIVNSIMAQKSLRDCAVLYRNNENSLVLINELFKNGIPFYIKERDQKFFNNMIVLDVKAFIKLSLDNTDYNSYKRIRYKKDFFLSKEIMESSCKEGPWSIEYLSEVNYPSEKTRKMVNDYLSGIKSIVRAKGSDIINSIFNRTSYGEYLIKNGAYHNYSNDHIAEVKYLLNVLTNDCSSAIDVLTKLDMLENAIKEASKLRGEDVVTLSTIHSAKGLEWTNVYLMSIVNEIIPSRQAITAHKDGDKFAIEEERNLFFVGMTRPKSYLDIIVPKSINGFNYSGSMFVTEINRNKKRKAEASINTTNILVDLTKSLESNISIGDKLYHKIFKQGKVSAINNESLAFTVEFSGEQQKHFKLNALQDGFFKRIID